MRLGYLALAGSIASLTHVASANAQSTYYVAVDGNDRSDGSKSAPWRTLQRAATRRSPGDTVVVRRGTYAGFDFRTRGTKRRPIKFIADDGVIIDDRNRKTPDGINLEGVRYVTIENFTIESVQRAGIRVVTDCKGVQIRNNRTLENGRWGIFTGFCNDIVIENNEASGSIEQHGIYHSNSGDNPIIRNNLVTGNSKNGIHINGDASEGGDGIISGALVEGNVIYGNGKRGGSGINCDGMQDSVIRNNLLFDNHATGIALYKINSAEGPKGNVVTNNTVVMPAGQTRWAMILRASAGPNTVVNNILINNHATKGTMQLYPDANPRHMRSDYNIVVDRFTLDDERTTINLARWRKASGADKHSRVAVADDLFVDWKRGDFRLKRGSPAIDAGTATHATAVDLAGNARPTGKRVDIGALEVCTGRRCKLPRPGPNGLATTTTTAPPATTTPTATTTTPTATTTTPVTQAPAADPAVCPAGFNCAQGKPPCPIGYVCTLERDAGQPAVGPRKGCAACSATTTSGGGLGGVATALIALAVLSRRRYR